MSDSNLLNLSIDKYRIVFSYDVPHVIIKKTFLQFRLKIFNIITNKECKLISANIIKSTELQSLKIQVTLSDYEIIYLKFNLAIKKKSQEIYKVTGQQDSLKKSKGKLSKSVPAVKDEFNPCIKVENPLFGKNMDVIRKVSVSASLGISTRNQTLFQFHETSCNSCISNTPCSKSKFKSVNVLLKTNEIQCYFRLMVSPKSKSIGYKNVLNNIPVYDFTTQVLSNNVINNICDSYNDDEFLSEKLITPENAFQLLITLEGNEDIEKTHYLSPSILVEDYICPESMGIDFSQKFWNLFIAGLPDNLQSSVKSLSCYQNIINNDIRISGSINFDDADLFLFLRDHCNQIDIKHFIRRSDSMGNTILHYAAALRYYLLLDYLLDENEKRGKDPLNLSVVNTPDINGRTPLHYASLVGHRNTTVCLLAHYANTTRKDINGRIPLYYARSINAVSVSKLLKRWSQVRETQVLISSLSIEKQKLQEQVKTLREQLAKESLKAKKSKKKLTVPAHVHTNPLFGRSSPTKSMQHGKLILNKGTPVFTSTKKEKRKKRSRNPIETSRGREHELRSLLEQQRMINNVSRKKIKTIIKECKNTSNTNIDYVISNLQSILSILDGTETIRANISPSVSSTNIIAPPLDISISNNKRKRISLLSNDRSPKPFVVPVNINNKISNTKIRRKKQRTKKSNSPIDNSNPIESKKEKPEHNMPVPTRQLTNTLFEIKDPKLRNTKAKSTMQYHKRKRLTSSTSTTTLIKRNNIERVNSEPILNDKKKDIPTLGNGNSLLSQPNILGNVYKDKKLLLLEKNYKRGSTDPHILERKNNKTVAITFAKISTSGNLTVKTCSIHYIVDWLVDGNSDTTLLATFLLTYRNFISPNELLLKLISKWDEIPIPLTKPESPIKQRRIVYIIRYWIDKYYTEDFKYNSTLSTLILSFSNEKIMQHHLPSLRNTITKAIERNQNDSRVKNLICSPRSILPKELRKVETNGDIIKLEFLDIHPVELARQLTVIESKLMSNISGISLVRLVNSEEKINAISSTGPLIKRFNLVSSWVSTEIVLQSNLKKRVYVLKKFIKLAKACYEINNFNSLLEILSGLNNASVARLKKTWKALPNKIFEKFRMLDKFMDNEMNYNKYRSKLSKIEGPVLPYFGIILRDISFLDLGNESIITLTNSDNKTTQTLINFEKLYLLQKLISQFEEYQKRTYNFKKVPQVVNYLNNLVTLSDDTIYEYSLLCEPINELQNTIL